MMKNRVTKYFFYALGEILLVVAGILIALAVNNEVDERKERRLEEEIKGRIHQEFEQNRVLLQYRMGMIETSEGTSRALMDLMGKEISPEDHPTIDSLIFYTIEYAGFRPALMTLEELTQTGRIGVIKDDSLRNMLLQWSMKLNVNKSSFVIFEKWVEDGILPFLSRHIALKDVDMKSDLGYTRGSAFDNGYDQLFKSREFENILDNHIYHHNLIAREYASLDALMGEILDRTRPESGD